jgi:hypothetical protein
MDTLTFFYDALGNPVRVDRAHVNSGSPSYLFRYDRQNRLQDYIGYYGSVSGSGEFWTRYTYSDDNRTVWDTTYTLIPEITSWPPPENEFFLAALKKYDREGRVIQVTGYFNGVLTTGRDTSVEEGTQSYTYDARGDWQIGLTVYDDKINYHRTNKVWMFVDDVYSANNSTPIDAYNLYGLPVKFNFNVDSAPEPVYSPILFGLTYGNTVIEYDCDLPKGLVPGE